MNNLEKLTKGDLILLAEYKLFIENFKNKCVNKFIAGRIEHADEDPMGIDHLEELMEEVMDMVSYMYLYKKHTNEKLPTNHR